jgi:hypothetical protein
MAFTISSVKRVLLTRVIIGIKKKILKNNSLILMKSPFSRKLFRIISPRIGHDVKNGWDDGSPFRNFAFAKDKSA